MIWRALRRLHPGWWFFYSIAFWLVEVVVWTMGLCFVYSLYYQIDRPGRDIASMLEQDAYPQVDIFICRYSEPVEVLEATVVAALNIDYPGTKLCVHILDDGNSPEVKSMQRRLVYQMKYMGRQANLKYVARPKVSGVPHHAKAGNINHCLMTESSHVTEYILVLDCDMIIHPTLLRRTLGHFLRARPDGEWEHKDFAALLQTPQDFWNVDKDDPMVHCARFFYGPMLMGRDGAGATPCCGTGVIFKRDILVSVGGQSYGSVTEDCNTAMQLLSSGFANMFMDERLMYGMAPETLSSVFKQRLRWAMGAIQILYRDNPLRKRGLTVAQSCLFFEIGAHHYLAFGTAFMAVVPILFVLLSASPIVVRYLWEFCIVFGVFFISNRLMMIWAHKGCLSGGSLEMWRGGQMWIWMCPNHMEACIKTFFAEAPVLRNISFEIKFNVTEKSRGSSNVLETFLVTWLFLLYLLASASAIVYFIVMASLETYTAWELIIKLTAIMWSIYLCLCIWPPVSLLLPRIETDRGWKISWDQPLDDSKYIVDEKKRIVKRKRWDLSRMLSREKLERMEKGEQSLPPQSKKMFPSLSENVGRVALPQRTAKTLLQSGTYTSTILPEPGRIERKNSKRIDTRHLSLAQVYSQIHSKSLAVTASKVSQKVNGKMDQVQRKSDREAVYSAHDGKLFKDGVEVDVGTLTEKVVAQLKLNSLPHESSSEIQSPFVENPIETHSSKESRSKEESLLVTSSGRLFRGGEQVSLATLVDHVNANVMLPSRNSGSNDEFTSPFEEIAGALSSNEGPSVANDNNIGSHPVATHLDSKHAGIYGRDLLRSMTMSLNETISKDFMPAAQTDSVMLQDIPGSQIFNQQGSIISSALFRNLSQMQPSALEKKGFIIPVVPDTVFDHTIISRPSFDFRILPRSSFWFFLVNVGILCGIIASGILSIFYNEDSHL
jgi:cellulose synthase/poly-beta-1,6-N-acetylglucosamine synthase-like glycosyltransferase